MQTALGSRFKVLGLAVAIISSLIFTTLYVASPSSFGQGPLTPPGPPGPTFKTLEQVEPRTPITNLPVTISQPGSYYLVASLTNVLGGGVDGISISADDVAIDLNGFALVGRGSDNGITVVSPQRNLTVRNGTIRNWGFRAVNAELVSNGVFEKLQVSNSGGGLIIGAGCVARDCTANVNASTGIGAGEGSLVTDCAVFGNFNDGIVGARGVSIIGCTVRGNGRYGIDVNDGSTVSGCTVTSNTVHGIQVTLACRVTENLCHKNGVDVADASGIRVTSSFNRIEANQVIGNKRGIEVQAGGNLIIKNNAADNPPGGGGADYILAAGNTLGPTNNLVGAGGIITNQNPWANFSF